ncbi:MAG: hypothetical protein WC838_07095 [Candidatus Margulisiibacteriota bacterium]|jgi:hypothetical protein
MGIGDTLRSQNVQNYMESQIKDSFDKGLKKGLNTGSKVAELKTISGEIEQDLMDSIFSAEDISQDVLNELQNELQEKGVGQFNKEIEEELKAVGNPRIDTPEKLTAATTQQIVNNSRSPEEQKKLLECKVMDKLAKAYSSSNPEIKEAFISEAKEILTSMLSKINVRTSLKTSLAVA